MNTIFMKKRDPIVCVFLTMITFGIYGIIWMYKTIKAVRALEGKDGAILETLLYLLVPIYPWYWAYTRCSMLYKFAQEDGVDIDRNNKGWYMVFAIFFGKGIILYLTQHKLNKFSDNICGDKAYYGDIDHLMFKLLPDCDIMFMRLYRIVSIITLIMIFNVIFYNLILIFIGKHPNVQMPCTTQYGGVAPSNAVAVVEKVDETIPEI